MPDYFLYAYDHRKHVTTPLILVPDVPQKWIIESRDAVQHFTSPSRPELQILIMNAAGLAAGPRRDWATRARRLHRSDDPYMADLAAQIADVCERPIAKRLVIHEGDDCGVVELDGHEWTLRDGECVQMVMMVRDDYPAPVSAAKIAKGCGRRADRIYRKLPSGVQAMIETPATTAGYRMRTRLAD